jgi:hypothetical protein
MAEWADERAEQIIDQLVLASRATAIGVLASMLRVARAEGVSEGIERAFKVDQEAFDKVFGSRS